MEIENVVHRPDLLEKAVHVFWNQWGNESNFKLYEDCIRQSLKAEDDLPLFNVIVHQEQIIGTYALLRNDMNSRQDLCPWLACLYVNPEYRGGNIGSRLLAHASGKVAELGFSNFYLSSDLEGYYEKYGWKQEGEAYGVFGDSIKVYQKRSG